jgi:hypothetical protein
MKKKLKELCASLPEPKRLQSSLDNVATKIFYAVRFREYIHSKSEPEPRYGINVDTGFLKHHNEILDDFKVRFGPNEQYLINKILYSPYNILFIIGGIGVGKTSFAHYLITTVMKEFRHAEGLETTQCPCPIYVDFLDWGHNTFSNKTSEEIQETFSAILCDRIENEFATRNFFNIEQEVGSVWEDMIAAESSMYQKNAAISHIITRLREENAETKALSSHYAETIEKRKQIRIEMKTGKNLRRFYLAALMRYVKAKYYDNHPTCFLLIVDNVDREPIEVQQAVKMILKPFARSGGVRTVVTARQTTFYQTLYDDGLSEPVDQVAYCGPSPVDILLGRMGEFLSDNEEYKEFYTPEALPVLVDGIKRLKDDYLTRDWFTSFLLSFTGRSVRKALILGQNLINNSVYDPYEIGRFGAKRVGIGHRDVQRALIVGANTTYTWTAGGLIENIFQVQEYPGKSYLIKSRILRALIVKEEYGVKVKPLIYLLNGFGYSQELILEALNELLQKPKRLLWSDSVRQFESVEDLMTHGNTYLHISSIGQGYAKNLYKSVEYIQEVMLDTAVDTSEFGHGWQYGKMEDRLKLVSRFCGMLLSQEEAELRTFIGNHGSEEYARMFGTRTFISKEILESMRYNVLALLNYFVESMSKKDPLFLEFAQEQSTFYTDRILVAANLERELLES